LTAERFVPNPFSDKGERLYWTGDNARYRDDGNLEFLGRRDDQVKLRGYRIELGEIEAVLREHPAIRHVAVVASENVHLEKFLTAYVVGNISPLQVSALKDYLKRALPEYMVPAAIIELQELPLTQGGKLDRSSLPQPKIEFRNETSICEAPQTQMEEIIAGIWAKTLGLERVGRHDNFFEIGGHSLLATRVISRIRQILNVEIPLRSLFTSECLLDFAGTVEQISKQTVTRAPEIAKVTRDAELPLSYAQERLWFIEQLEPGNTAYNLPMAVRLRGELDVDALGWSLKAIVKRHEVLRTHFAVVEGRPVQVIEEEWGGRLEEVDLRGEGEKEKQEKVEELAREEANRGFDLNRGPLLRARVVKVGEQEHVLLLTMHHIVSDAWSRGVLVRELGKLYGSRVAGEEGKEGKEGGLEELGIQYGDYAVWQREWLSGEVLEEQVEYWRKQLAGVEVLELASDRVRGAVASHGGERERVEIGAEVVKRVKGMCREEGVTLFMVLLGSFQVLLGRYSGQKDVAVGTPIANRTRAELEGLIGFFVNTLVLRTELGEGMRVRELLGRVREVCLGAYAHQDLPFERLVE
jgi:hypothetical protein